jgi:hypothetical protein
MERRMPVNDPWIPATAMALQVPVVAQDDDYVELDGDYVELDGDYVELDGEHRWSASASSTSTACSPTAPAASAPGCAAHLLGRCYRFRETPSDVGSVPTRWARVSTALTMRSVSLTTTMSAGATGSRLPSRDGCNRCSAMDT